ncbi:hypothetical protein FGO68_gene10023 [Halteria grandinella]|uniref:EamA domain-containing protein n=1 Tax=Halteria grandinella TaxID=5974 RepID=A0A8J8NKV8_HALGN|nr:hypothetical protein FGO68_gene10023 [Halteria grandinella]
MRPPLEQYSAIEICCCRSSLGILILYLIIKKEKLPIYNKFQQPIKWLLARAFIGLLFFGTFTYCVGQGAVSTVFLSQNMAPMITSIAAMYLFKEKLTRIEVINLLIGFGGVTLMLLPKEESQASKPTDIILILLIISLPFQMSCLQLFIRQMKDVHYAIINFYYTLVSALGYALYVMYQYSTNDYSLSAKFSFKNLSILFFTSLSHVGAIIFWTLAFQNGKAGKVGIITYSQLIYSMIVDLLIFEIRFTQLQGVGMLIVFASSFIVALTKY